MKYEFWFCLTAGRDPRQVTWLQIVSLCLKFMESLFISQTTHQKDYLGWLALPIWDIFSFEAKSSLGISMSESRSLYYLKALKWSWRSRESRTPTHFPLTTVVFDEWFWQLILFLVKTLNLMVLLVFPEKCHLSLHALVHLLVFI